jgi:hypothetical protein
MLTLYQVEQAGNDSNKPQHFQHYKIVLISWPAHNILSFPEAKIRSAKNYRLFKNNGAFFYFSLTPHSYRTYPEGHKQPRMKIEVGFKDLGARR